MAETSEDRVSETLVRKNYRGTLTDIEEREEVLKDKWHKHARECQEIYLGDADNVPFNILFSNTEILVPAVFSKVPVAKVLRRWDDRRADKPAKAAERMVSWLMDTNLPSYPTFLSAVEDVVLDAALPGQGVARLRIVNGVPLIDLVQWHKFIWGFCERWEDCPWKAFRMDLTVDDVIKQFYEGREGEARVFRAKAGGDNSTSDNTKTAEKKPPTVAVYELWDKATKLRCFLCEYAEDCVLMCEEDPYRLEGFFPTPTAPLSFLHSTTDTLPRPLYRLYKSQAEELNELTRRIKRVTKAIQVRGLYNGQIGNDLESLINADENENVLMPMQSASGIMMDGGLDKQIWIMPVEKLITVLRELLVAREQCKSTIYEILGIGDILRGVTKASETLGAQEIKDKWGTLRINKTRERTSTYVRDLMRLLIEGAAKHTPIEMWAKITSLPFVGPVETQVLRANGQQVPPELTWEQALKTLQDDLSRSYTVDIETNSTVDAEATMQKQDNTEFMNAFGQAMSGLTPLASGSVEGFELSKKILVMLLSRFEIGQEVEAQLEALPAPKALQGPPLEVQKMQADLQKREQDLAKKEQGVAQGEASLKDMQTKLEGQLRDVDNARKELAQAQTALGEQEKMAMERIDLREQLAVLEIEKAGLKVTKEKMAADASRQAAQAARQPAGGKK